MKETKVIALRDKLEYFFQNFHSTDHVKVSIALQNAWGKQSIWLVRQLIQQFFGLEHPEQCQWFRIISGSVLLTFLASMNQKVCLIKNCKKKVHLMKIAGVIHIKVDGVLVIEEKKDETFSFENSLIQAAVDRNIEAVQFLLKYLTC